MVQLRNVEEIAKLMNYPEIVRNTSIIAHVDHGKTTLSDSLLAAAGIIAKERAGQQLVLDTWELEQKRQMTVFASNISLVHTFKGREYLINLIDTPGHIDFSGAVTRSLRAVDGALVVVDAVEGPMTQTETVLMQALRERVRPILFINKVDRLIKEIKLTPEEIQRKFGRIILRVNSLIEKYAPPEHKKDWQVKVEDGRVAFGSALHKWGLNLPHMKTKGVSFKDIIDAYSGDPEEIGRKVDALSKKAPLYEPVLDMFCEHLPNPLEAQPYRESQIWPTGDAKSPVGEGMAKVDPNAPLLSCITSIEVDPQRGVIAIGRVFSGTVEKGKTVTLVTSHQTGTIQQVYMCMVADKVIVDKVPAGNIAAISGLPSVHVGETLAEAGVETQSFEGLKYVSEPVVTVAVEPADVKDLPLFDKVMHKLTLEDPNLHFVINKESGEYLLSGMGELHLEVTAYRMQEANLKVKISKPIVIYRETISHDYNGSPLMGKSPNKHNKLWVSMEKLPDEIIEATKVGKVSEMQTRDERQKTLKQFGWSTDDARNVTAIEGTNILINRIKGRQYVEEIMDHVKSGFREAVYTSVLAKEPAYGLKINLEDVMVHEDPVHRGPAQILPMTWRPIWCAFLLSDPKLLEPIMSFECKVPNEFVSNVIAIVQKRRGKILDMINEEDMVVVKAEMPVSESFGIADELRSSTQGRAFWATQFSRWAPVPENMQAETIKQIRERRGLSPTPPKPEEFYEEA
jgi:elongation factor 2